MKMKELFMDRCAAWADLLNDYYQMDVTDEEVAHCIEIDEQFSNGRSPDEISFIKELEDETFSDTLPREMMLDAVCNERIGMRAPCIGDDDGYHKRFHDRMRSWLNQNRRGF